MILIPEQVQQIRFKLEEARREKIKYDEHFEDERALGNTDNGTKLCIKDYTVGHQKALNEHELTELKNALLYGEYLKERNTSRIDVGTSFYLQFDGEEDIEKITFLDNAIGMTLIDGYITKDTIIGKAVYGKTEGETFSYKVDGIEISGTIKKIITNKDDYTQFITQKQKYQRSSKKYKHDHHMMLQNKEEYIEELAVEEELTASQLAIVKEEFARLTKYINARKTSTKTKEYYKAASRLYCVSKLLKNVRIAKLPEDGSIGIGSSFSVMFFAKDGVETHRYELINSAVSDELSNEYVEKISPLGTKIFGLKNNEEFRIQTRDNTYVSGIVYDIDNSKEQIKTTDPLVYQKNRRLKRH